MNFPSEIIGFIPVVAIIIFIDIAVFFMSLGSKMIAICLPIFIGFFSFVWLESIILTAISFAISAVTGFVVYYFLSRAKCTENWRKWRKKHPEKNDDSGNWFSDDSGGSSGGGGFGGFGGGSSGGGGASGRW